MSQTQSNYNLILQNKSKIKSVSVTYRSAIGSHRSNSTKKPKNPFKHWCFRDQHPKKNKDNI